MLPSERLGELAHHGAQGDRLTLTEDRVTAWRGAPRGGRPLVVMLHGRWADERDIISLARWLPDSFAYAAPRGPIAEGGGYAWFQHHEIGRPVASSFTSALSWMSGWLDEIAPRPHPVLLLGFSDGAALAGGLIVTEPSRYAGAALLCGHLPAEVGLPLLPGRLLGLPLFVAQGERDQIIPARLSQRAWDYLVGESGAKVVARRDPVGHSLAPEALLALAGWLREHEDGGRAAPTGP